MYAITTTSSRSDLVLKKFIGKQNGGFSYKTYLVGRLTGASEGYCLPTRSPISCSKWLQDSKNWVKLGYINKRLLRLQPHPRDSFSLLHCNSTYTHHFHWQTVHTVYTVPPYSSLNIIHSLLVQCQAGYSSDCYDVGSSNGISAIGKIILLQTVSLITGIQYTFLDYFCTWYILIRIQLPTPAGPSLQRNLPFSALVLWFLGCLVFHNVSLSPETGSQYIWYLVH